MAPSLADAIVGIGGEFASIITREWYLLSTGLLVWVVPHILLQYALPAVRPSFYDSLGVKDAAKGLPVDRAKLAADGRTKIICALQGIYFTVLCIQGLLSEDASVLIADHYASTPLSKHLSSLAASFFVWDLIICLLDGQSGAYLIHGVACLCVFLAGLHPFQQYMALVSLLFEASTPFLHLRSYLIQSGQGDGALFLITSALFALAFFLTRILLGLSASYAWWLRMLDLLASGKSHNDAILYMFLFCNALLCALNVYWMFHIVRTGLQALAGKHKEEKRVKTA